MNLKMIWMLKMENTFIGRLILPLLSVILLLAFAYRIGEMLGYRRAKQVCAVLAVPDCLMMRDICIFRNTGADSGLDLRSKCGFDAGRYDFLLPGIYTDLVSRKEQHLEANRQYCLWDGFDRKAAERSEKILMDIYDDAETVVKELDYPIMSPEEVKAAIIGL